MQAPLSRAIIMYVLSQQNALHTTNSRKWDTFVICTHKYIPIEGEFFSLSVAEITFLEPISVFYDH